MATMQRLKKLEEAFVITENDSNMEGTGRQLSLRVAASGKRSPTSLNKSNEGICLQIWLDTDLASRCTHVQHWRRQVIESKAHRYEKEALSMQKELYRFENRIGLPLVDTILASFKISSQIHRHGHTVTVHQQHGWQPPKQDLKIAHVPQTIRLALKSPFYRRRQRREDDGSVVTVLGHEVVENEVLSAGRESVEG